MGSFRMPRPAWLGLCLAIVACWLWGAGGAVAATSVNAAADDETPPIAESGDLADDPAIWVNPADPAKSRVVAATKGNGLEVYDLQGDLVKRFDGFTPNNVDVRDNIVGAADMGGSGEMRFFKFDPASGDLTPYGRLDTSGVAEHGFCMYKGAGGKLYAFPNDVTSTEQWELDVSGSTIDGRRVRGPWQIGTRGDTKAEGCVADDATGQLYVSDEEEKTIYRYGAEPTDSTAASEFAKESTEGLAIVGEYLIASNQGDDSYLVYDKRSGSLLRNVEVVPGARADGCEHTDGIDAVAANLGPLYPTGLFVCQDESNVSPGSSGNQNFKFVALNRVLPIGGPPPPPPPPAPPVDPATPPPPPAPPVNPATPPPPPPPTPAALRDLRVAAAQRGGVVRGQVQIVIAGSTFRAELRGTRGGPVIQIRRSLRAGAMRFAVTLSRTARAALARQGKLRFTLTIRVTPPGGAPAVITKRVVVQRAVKRRAAR